MDFDTPAEATQKRITRPLLMSIGIAVMVAMMASMLITQIAGATPPSGLSATTLASGVLDKTHHGQPKDRGRHDTYGMGTDIHTISVVRYEIEPGGSFGWHQHGGPLWVVVAEGTLTFYGAKAGCVGKKYATGSAFLDPGDITHTARNEGHRKLVIFVTFMLPEGAPARIDMPNPGVCPF